MCSMCYLPDDFCILQSPLWMVTEDPATGCHGDLYVSGSRVVWYEGLHPHNRTVRKVYSVESEILQAFWCQFSEESVSPSGGESRREDQSLRCVCVREHSCLTFFMQTGAIHYIPLPFLVSGWAALQVDIHPSLHPICVSVIHPFFPPPISLIQFLFWKWVGHSSLLPPSRCIKHGQSAVVYYWRGKWPQRVAAMVFPLSSPSSTPWMTSVLQLSAGPLQVRHNPSY